MRGGECRVSGVGRVELSEGRGVPSEWLGEKSETIL